MNDIPAADTILSFHPISPQRAFEEIATQIRALISSGKLKPGDRLPPERQLSVQFDVSRNTLREALRSLEIAGLLELRKGSTGGAFVVPGNPDVIINGLRDLYYLGAISPKDLTDARIWIEAVVVRVACERATKADIAALEQNVAAVEQADKAGDGASRAKGNIQFHVLLGKATHNPILSIAMEGIMEIMGQFVKLQGPQGTPHVLPSRRRLLEYIRERNADAAEAEMTRHLKRVHRLYMSKLEKTKQPAVAH
jgi:GntR family transcriptional repressor for pyruvate dehydrogenase complex